MEKKEASQDQETEEPVPLHSASVQDVAMGIPSIAHMLHSEVPSSG